MRAEAPFSAAGRASAAVSALALLITCLTRFPAGAASPVGRIFYVATTGDDSNAGALDAPFRTLAYAVSGLQPGDTLYVRGGTYAESLEDAIPGGSSWSAPVTVAAYPGEAPLIQPLQGANRVLTFSRSTSAYIVIDGFVLDAAAVTYDAVKLDYMLNAPAPVPAMAPTLADRRFTLGPCKRPVCVPPLEPGWQYPHHIRIRNCEIRNAPYQGISVSGVTGQASYSEFLNLNVHDNGTNDFHHGAYIETAHNLVDHCRFYRNAGWGIQIYHTPESGADKNTISNNQCYNNAKAGGRGAGIVIAAGRGNMAFNNIVWGNKGGIQVDYNALDTALYNNTVYSNGAYGLNIGPGSSNADIRNNIVYLHTTPVVDQGAATNLAANLLANPAFVDAAALNFHIAPSSPAIDTGVTIPQVTMDFDSVSRPQGRAYDIGAYEALAASRANGAPVAYWKFNEGAGTVAADSSGNGLTATLTNVAWAADRNGSAGKAASFNGVTSFGNVNENGFLTTPTALTVAFWIECQGGGAQDPRIVSKRYSWDIKLNGSTRDIQFSTDAGFAVASGGCPLNTWRHVVVTYNNGTVKIYFNGVPQPLPVNTFAAGMTIPSQTYGLSIGVDAGGQRFFNGLLANLRIYNAELSATDIQTLYSSGT